MHETRVLDVSGDRPPREAIDEAVGALQAGEAVVVPTETVYGLAVDPFLPAAIERLFLIKERPRDVPIAVIVADASQGATLVDEVDARAGRLMAAFWPGPLTLVLRRRPGLDVDLGVEATTIGLRCPAHPVPRLLAARAGPIATTSANRHGEAPIEDPAQLVARFGGLVPVVLDAGRCAGTPSTVVDLSGDELRILREGPVTLNEMIDALS